MNRKIMLFFLVAVSSISCDKEVHTVLMKRGDWSIQQLYVKKDFSGKISEYYVSNAGTYHFEKEEKGKFTDAADSTFSSKNFEWYSDGDLVNITYEGSNVSEKWKVLSSDVKRQEWEINQDIIHETGGLTFTEKRYRKIILVK